jgi:hypothetical protein
MSGPFSDGSIDARAERWGARDETHEMTSRQRQQDGWRERLDGRVAGLVAQECDLAEVVAVSEDRDVGGRTGAFSLGRGRRFRRRIERRRCCVEQ